jgi:parallel beta-helix repeat protein
MTRHELFAALVLATAWLLAPRSVHAAESYDNCTGFVTSVPAVISTAGTWCLKQDLNTANTSGSAITINASNVTLDCNDFKLGGLAAGVGTNTEGVFATDRFNVTVRRCNIRGFFRGIFFVSASGTSSTGHVIEDNRFDGNRFSGIVVFGNGSVIRRNRVFNTGGSTQQTSAYGVYAVYSVDVLDNTISGVVATSGSNSWATGVYTVAGVSTRLIGNTIRGVVADGTGSATAIANSTGDDRMVIHDNDLAGNAATDSRGVTCGTATDSVGDNVISGFTTPMSVCTNSGGNDIVP